MTHALKIHSPFMNEPPAPPPTILVVDDIPANLNVLRHFLEPAGYRMLGATSGPAALSIVARTQPDLILLDVAMPGIDGFETCRQLKQLPEGQPIPVLFVTARNEPEALVEGFNAGCVDYIVKPFHKAEILVRVQTHVQIARLHQALSRRNAELERLTAELTARQQELEEALANLKTLRGLIPICAHCKKIRDDRGFWQQVETYVMQHSDAQFSHGICPECVKIHFPECVRRNQAVGNRE